MRIFESNCIMQLLFVLLLVGSLSFSLPNKCNEEEGPDTMKWVTNEQIPILSWHSINLTKSSLKDYQELKDCGYTYSLATIWDNEDPPKTYNANLLQIAMDYAEKADIKVIAGCYELTTDPENTVRRFMNHPALVGWHLKDEPSLSEFQALGNLAKKIKAIDDKHFVYVNLRPSDAKPDVMGTSSYTTYVNEYLRLIPVDFVSFDKYPCQLDKSGNLYVLDYWYDNLQIIADAAKRAGKYFWAFASSVKFEPEQATPTIETLRMQMYTNLAYGAQGLQYFVYKNPSSPVYEVVKQMNEEIQNFAKVFLNAMVISMRLKEAINSGKIGKPSLGTVFMFGWRDEAYYKSDPWRGTWKGEGGGVLVNQAPHQLDLLQWFMGNEIEELYGVWENLNHPYIEVEDTALAILRFKNGGVANIVVSNSQKPGIFGKVHIHGSNGASVGVQTDGGAMFIAGMTSILEPPVNDLWSVVGEENKLKDWIKEDSDFFNSVNSMEYYHKLQIEDFIEALIDGRKPMVTGEEGRVTVEIFSAIYRSQRERRPIKFPLMPEYKRGDFDGRL